MTHLFRNNAFAFLAFASLLNSTASAADLDLTTAVVVAPVGLNRHELQAVKMLTEEVARRSWVRWETAEAMPKSGPAIVVGPASLVGKVVNISGGPVGREGYRIGIFNGTVYVAGDDARGVLFGVGRLLRE